MVRSKIKENPAIPEELLIDEGMLLKWTKGTEEVVIPDEICKIVTYIRKTFAQWQKQEDIEPSDLLRLRQTLEKDISVDAIISYI